MHFGAQKDHVAAYLAYLQTTGRRHDEPLLDEDAYAAVASASPSRTEQTRKLAEAEEMAVYEKRYQERVRFGGVFAQ